MYLLVFMLHVEEWHDDPVPNGIKLELRDLEEIILVQESFLGPVKSAESNPQPFNFVLADCSKSGNENIYWK